MLSTSARTHTHIHTKTRLHFGPMSHDYYISHTKFLNFFSLENAKQNQTPRPSMHASKWMGDNSSKPIVARIFLLIENETKNWNGRSNKCRNVRDPRSQQVIGWMLRAYFVIAFVASFLFICRRQSHFYRDLRSRQAKAATQTNQRTNAANERTMRS